MSGGEIRNHSCAASRGRAEQASALAGISGLRSLIRFCCRSRVYVVSMQRTNNEIGLEKLWLSQGFGFLAVWSAENGWLMWIEELPEEATAGCV